MELHLNPLKTKVIGELTFISESPLHIGAGGEEVRRTLLRLLDGRVFIPASTWKGSIRSLAEKIAKTMTFAGIPGVALTLYKELAGGISYTPQGDAERERVFNEVMSDIIDSLLGRKPSHFITAPQTVEPILGELGYEEEEIEEVKTKKGEEATRKLAKQMVGDYLAANCPLGALLGNKVLAAKLRFIDSILTIAETESRPGVGVDRKSGRIEEKALYFTETAPTNTKIKLRIIADNLIPRAEDSLIMAATLEMIKSIGLQIGARKSAGLGNLTVSVEDSKFYLIDLKQDKDGTQLANPFKYVQPLHLEEFIKWLKGSGSGDGNFSS